MEILTVHTRDTKVFEILKEYGALPVRKIAKLCNLTKDSAQRALNALKKEINTRNPNFGKVKLGSSGLPG